jgi:GNAT superfamily N-acetyltransferase
MSTDTMRVRPVRWGDRTGWLRFWADYHAYGRPGGTALPDAVTEATWERFLQGHESMRALVAELEGAAGRLRAHGLPPQHEFRRAGLPPSGPVRGGFAARQGIGRALIELVYVHAEAAGARRVYWHVEETNAPALRLYDRVASRSGHVVVYRRDL